MKKILKWRDWEVGDITRLLVFVLAMVVSAAVIVSLYAENDSMWREITRIGTAERVVARAGAKRLEAFLERIETDLALISHMTLKIGLSSDELKGVFESMLVRYEGTPVVTWLIVDKEGKTELVADADSIREALGTDLSDRDYFVWAKAQREDADEVYLSEPVVSRGGIAEGKVLVIVALPLFSQGEFDGVVFAGLDLEMVMDDYIASLEVYEGGKGALLDEEGVVITGLTGYGLSGQSLKEIISEAYVCEEEKCERMLNELMSGNNNWMELRLPLGGESANESWILGFAPVSYGGRNFTVVTMVNSDEARGRMGGQRFFLRWGLVVAGFGGLVIGMFSIFGMRRAQSLWFKRGFYSGQKSGKSGKKSEKK